MAYASGIGILRTAYEAIRPRRRSGARRAAAARGDATAPPVRRRPEIKSHPSGGKEPLRGDHRTLRLPNRGAWRPVLEFLAAAIRRQTGIRDYIAGEKAIQGFLAAYLGATDHFVFHTERELGDGYADICLEPFLVRFADMRHGYLIELKYLKRSASATEERVAVAALPGRRTLGAAVPIGALHRPGARIPRLGTGAQRRDSPPADLKIARCAHPRRSTRPGDSSSTPVIMLRTATRTE